MAEILIRAAYPDDARGLADVRRRSLSPAIRCRHGFAGFYVAPEFRRRGIGGALIRAIEDEARNRGHTHVHLYADDAIAYYEKLDWQVVEQTLWMDHPMALMARELRGI